METTYRTTLKDQIKKLPLLGPAAVWVNSRLTGAWRVDPSYWVSKLVPNGNAQIVQVGSNDGKTGDPLNRLLVKRRGWKGLFVEPVPFLFERLKENYPDTERFSFENTVINDGSSVQFYWVDESAKNSIKDLPDWYDQLGSFSREHITNHIPELDQFVRETSLTGLTLEGLFAKHGITNVDVLHIDTEGADFMILSQLDLEKPRPRIILYERKHLSEEEDAAAFRFLEPHYLLYNLGADVLAVEKGAGGEFGEVLDPLRCYEVRNC